MHGPITLHKNPYSTPLCPIQPVKKFPARRRRTHFLHGPMGTAPAPKFFFRATLVRFCWRLLRLLSRGVLTPQEERTS